MTSNTDDKLVRPPGKQSSKRPQDNVVPLMPRIREKAARHMADRSAKDADEDDPGPNAA